MTADRADECSPPPGTASGTWHWLTEGDGRKYPREWLGVKWAVGGIYPLFAYELGWRYHSRVAEPEEIEALRQVVQQVCEQGTAEVAMLDNGLLECIDDLNGTMRLTPLGRRALGVEG